MTELLTVIILACQVHTGFSGSPEFTMHVQRECQRHLLSCLKTKETEHRFWNDVNVYECLRDTDGNK